MSTVIGSVFGMKEEVEHGGVVYEPMSLQISTFYGGKDRGKCVQLTSGSSSFHIQLETKEVEKLKQLLTEATE